jgi:hypothetical protein
MHLKAVAVYDSSSNLETRMIKKNALVVKLIKGTFR